MADLDAPLLRFGPLVRHVDVLLRVVELFRKHGRSGDRERVGLRIARQLDRAVHAGHDRQAPFFHLEHDAAVKRPVGNGNGIHGGDLGRQPRIGECRRRGRPFDPRLCKPELLFRNVDADKGRSFPDDRHDDLVRRHVPPLAELLGDGAPRRPRTALAVAVIHDPRRGGLDRQQFQVGLEVAKLLLQIGLGVLQLLHVDPLLLQRAGERRLGLLQADLRPFGPVLDLLFLPRDVLIDRPVEPDAGPFQEELRLVDLAPRALQDDLLRLLGEVVGLVHLLQLVQLFLRVLEVVLRVLQHLLRAAAVHRLVDFDKVLQLPLRFLIGALCGPEVERHRRLQRRQVQLGLLKRQLAQFQRVLRVPDLVRDLVGLEPEDWVPFGDLRPLRRRLVDDQAPPRLRTQNDLRHLVGLERPLQGDLDLERPRRDGVRLRGLGVLGGGIRDRDREHRGAGQQDGFQVRHGSPHSGEILVLWTGLLTRPHGRPQVSLSVRETCGQPFRRGRETRAERGD